MSELDTRQEEETDRESYILFDDEQGKRHVIYYITGTIIVDKNRWKEAVPP